MTYPAPDRTDHPEIQAPPTERLVPEDERTLPTAKKPVLLLCVAAAVLCIGGGLLGLQLDYEVMGLVLAALGLAAGVIGWVMAYGDARTGSATPAVATITAAIFCIAIAMDLGDIDEAADTNAFVAPGGGNITIPEDPAAIVDPDREPAATQP